MHGGMRSRGLSSTKDKKNASADGLAEFVHNHSMIIQYHLQIVDDTRVGSLLQ